MSIHVCARTCVRVTAYVCVHSNYIFMYGCVRVYIFTHTHTYTGGASGGVEMSFNPHDGIVQLLNLSVGQSREVATTSGVCHGVRVHARVSVSNCVGVHLCAILVLNKTRERKKGPT